MRIRLTFLLALLPAATVACGEATGPSAARLGEPFVLEVGEVALVDVEGLLVGFTAVTADSRCPTDVECVTAGDASVELWLRRPPSPRETHVLHTDGREGGSAAYDDFEVELLSLQPLPRSDRPVEPGQYRLELVVR